MSNLPKLVRDKIPEIIRESGNDYVAHADTDPLVLTGWLSKAGDMLEVCLALWSNSGLSFEDIIEAAEKKRREKGGFHDGIILWDIIHERLE